LNTLKKKYPHIYLYTSTNGLLLNEEKIKRLVASQLDEITFSADGPDQATYERYRQGGDFNRLTEIMTQMVQLRNISGLEVPFINWRYILFKWNDSKIKMNQTRKLAAKIGVDRLTWEITDHPPEAASKIYQIGSKAWQKIYYEIWDSSQIGNAIKGKRFMAAIKPKQKKIVASAASPVSIQFRIRNLGGAFWWQQTSSGRRIIRLGAQLYSKSRDLLDLNYGRVFLNNSLKSGEKDELEIKLLSPKNPGHYWLKFDMVSEGIDWFESGGSPVVWREFLVKP